MGSHRLTAAAAAVLLAACTSRTSGVESPPETTAVTRPATSTTTVATGPPAVDLGLGERGQTRDGNAVAVITYTQPVRPAAVEPEPNHEFAAAEGEICAGRRGAPRVTAESFAVELSDGTRRGRIFFGPQEPTLTEASLAAGECVRGWVNFEVPKGQRPVYVVFRGSTLLRWKVGGRSR